VRGFVQTTTAGVVRTVASDLDEAALVEGLRAGDPLARQELFDRYATHVQRILSRVLGREPELSDILHDTFVQAYGSVEGIRDATAIKSWLSTVAVFTARGVIRKRTLRRWLRFWDPAEIPEPEAPVSEETTREALRRTYAILEGLGAYDRIAFTLRFIEGMELTEVAAACGCSLATVKRRLSRAEKQFVAAAQGDEVLAQRIEGGRWGTR
jgi:RNA polymerase sigma-70 factor, ECF subfamily